MFQYTSDLHLERFTIDNYKYDDLIKVSAKVLLLLGDIGTIKSKILPIFLKDCSKDFELVLYVPGNHEYYNDNNIPMVEINNYYENLCSKFNNIIFLNNKTYNYNNITFIGSILWSKILSYERNHIKQVSNDLRNINITENQKLTIDKINELNKECINWLINELENNKNTIIILSHYLPSYHLIAKKYQSYIGNSMYANDLDYIMEKYKISYWLFGHSHASTDLTLYNTRCLSNPHGYIICDIKENNNYENNKIITI
ncbi:metallophosphatase [Hokovirus HKV1]|uniref:Metallophosphatase n=1 Tax=Hokovirus HKV1 TaxID=1977638 RepID=A0A1V0SFB1_9VIRU|nr:metallophosphatase [Hokovirus HKV1]